MKHKYIESEEITESRINLFRKHVEVENREPNDCIECYLKEVFEKLLTEGRGEDLEKECVGKILPGDAGICFASLIFNNPFKNSKKLRDEIEKTGLTIKQEKFSNIHGFMETISIKSETVFPRFLFYCNDYIACITNTDAKLLTNLVIMHLISRPEIICEDNVSAALFDMITSLKKIEGLKVMNKEINLFEPVSNLFSSINDGTPPSSDVAIELYDYNCVFRVDDCSSSSGNFKKYNFPVGSFLIGEDGFFCYNKIDYCDFYLERSISLYETLKSINIDDNKFVDDYISKYEETIEKIFYSFLEQYVTFAVFLSDCKSWLDKNSLSLDVDKQNATEIQEETKEQKQQKEPKESEEKEKKKLTREEKKHQKEVEKQQKKANRKEEHNKQPEPEKLEIVKKELDGYIKLMDGLSEETYIWHPRKKDDFSMFRQNYFEQYRDSGKKNEIYEDLKEFKSKINKEAEKKEERNNERINRITLGLSMFAIFSVAADVSTYIRNYHDESAHPSYGLKLPLTIIGLLLMALFIGPVLPSVFKRWKDKRKAKQTTEKK